MVRIDEKVGLMATLSRLIGQFVLLAEAYLTGLGQVTSFHDPLKALLDVNINWVLTGPELGVKDLD